MARHKHKKRPRRRFHRQSPPGAAPGVIAVHPESPHPVITATTYTADQTESIDVADIDQIPSPVDGSVLWLDIRGLGDDKILHALGQRFTLHPLALEDVVNVHQQVKVDDYIEHLFVVARVVEDEDHERTTQISIFIGRDFVITCQQTTKDSLVAVRDRLRDQRSQLRRNGADFLGYAIVDVIVDGYFPVLELYGQRLDDLEDLITDHPSQTVVHEIHAIRNILRTQRRVIWQHREAIHVLHHISSDLITTETRTFLRDCHDHTVQLVDLLEIYRETCSDLRDVYLSAVSNRMNEIMMVLTIIATIFIPLSFIAGVYGMNFDSEASPWNMPELRWYLGYPLALGLMTTVATGLLFFFWRRGWIWKRASC